MVGLRSVKQAPALLMTAGTNDQNTWNWAVKTQSRRRAGARLGAGPKKRAQSHTWPLDSHMWSQSSHVSAVWSLLEWRGHVKTRAVHAHLKVQTCIRHARPSVSCSMANSRLANWSHHTTVQYWFKSVQINNRHHVIKVPAPHCVEEGAF